jgi:hypothetical protein
VDAVCQPYAHFSLAELEICLLSVSPFVLHLAQAMPGVRCRVPDASAVISLGGTVVGRANDSDGLRRARKAIRALIVAPDRNRI